MSTSVLVNTSTDGAVRYYYYFFVFLILQLDIYMCLSLCNIYMYVFISILLFVKCHLISYADLQSLIQSSHWRRFIKTCKGIV